MPSAKPALPRRPNPHYAKINPLQHEVKINTHAVQNYHRHQQTGRACPSGRTDHQTAGLFDCSVILDKKGKRIDAKSILAVMTMAAKCGDEITIITNGRNDKEALEAIVALFQSKFGEDE